MVLVAKGLGRSKSVLYGRCERLWLMVLTAPPNLDDMLAARPTLDAMRAHAPDGFVTLTWVTAAAGFSMETEARQAASDITRACNDVIRAQATLIEAGGFPGAAVRMIISGMDLVASTKAPKKVFATLAETIRWCQEFNAVPGADDQDIVDAVSAFRTTG